MRNTKFLLIRYLIRKLQNLEFQFCQLLQCFQAANLRKKTNINFTKLNLLLAWKIAIKWQNKFYFERNASDEICLPRIQQF